MNIDANAVITKLNSKLADANLQITILELQLEQYEKAEEEPEVIVPAEEVKQ
jgi:hypothetical protein